MLLLSCVSKLSLINHQFLTIKLRLWLQAFTFLIDNQVIFLFEHLNKIFSEN
jgi:hypothetical protein